MRAEIKRSFCEKHYSCQYCGKIFTQPYKYWACSYCDKTFHFAKNHDRFQIGEKFIPSNHENLINQTNPPILHNRDKGPIVPKWVLINQPKIPQMPQNFRPNLSAQAKKFGIFEKKVFLGVRSPWPGLCLCELYDLRAQSYIHISSHFGE